MRFVLVTCIIEDTTVIQLGHFWNVVTDLYHIVSCLVWHICITLSFQLILYQSPASRFSRWKTNCLSSCWDKSAEHVTPAE